MLNIDHTDPQRIGHTYWSVGDYKTINKIAAFERANGDATQIKFHVMDDAWSKIDTSKEPETSWEDLLKLRAWQLRNRYKHVALMYSGGWDSHTVLMTFVKNRIPLDEIVCWDKTEYHADPELVDSYQTAKRIINEYNLTTKITVYQIPWHHHATIYKEAGEDYIYLPGCQLTFNQTSRIVNYERLTNFIDIKNKHIEGTAVFIEAHDKPRVNLWEGRWYHFYVDSSLYQYVGKGASEMFYCSPDALELQLKQAYMSVRFFENKINSIPGATRDLVHEVQSFKYPHLYEEWNRHIGRVCQDNDIAKFGIGKDESYRKHELYKLTNYTKEYVDEIYNIYTSGLHKVKEISGYDVIDGKLPTIISKQYYMKDFSKL